MFQFEQAGPQLISDRPPGQNDVSRTPPDRAFLAWGEHCVECAAPDCYRTCDLFDPTPAGKCRRFKGGLLRNDALGTADGPAAEVIFRRWGKLEAQGSALLLPSRTVSRMERLLHTISPIANRAGLWLSRVTGQARWATPMEALSKRITARYQRATADTVPNRFLAEIYNPQSVPVPLLFSASIDRARLGRAITLDQLPRPMTVTLDVQPGLSRHVIDAGPMRDILTSGLPFNLAIAPEGDEEAHLVFRRLDLYHDMAADAASSASTGAASDEKAVPAKCVVFDLDNTLWEGILLEGDVRVRDGIADLFRTLDERGILISVASKNAPDDARARLEAAGLWDYLLHPQIGWGPKSEGVRRIADAIDIGIDSLMFVDDNPFERAEVSQALPKVLVLPETDLPMLADHPRLKGSVTEESRSRRAMYQQAAAREETASAFGNDYIEFLRSCDIRLEIRRDRPEDIDRIAELVQRTNQLNFSGRKYGREEILAILADPARERHVISCSDRFGSYGKVGFCLSRTTGDIVEIDDFMLSCRVQGKFIEQAIFWYLSQQASPPASAVVVNFKRTDRNRAAEMVLEKLGFTPDATGRLRRAIKNDDLAVDFLTIN
jgi:FkbH-like protein